MKLAIVILYLAAVLVADNREDATFFEFDDNVTQTTNSTTAASSVPVPADLPTDLSAVHKAADGVPSTALAANFKSLQEVESGHYPASFPGGKARLTKDTKKLEFFAVFVNGEIVLVLDNFDLSDISSKSDHSNDLRFRIGNEEVLFKFFKFDKSVITYITIGSREGLTVHTTLQSGGKLKIHLVKNVGIQIDGQEKDKDLSLSSTMPIVQTANGKEALKLTVDSSGMLKAAFDLSLETPFADDGSNTLAANLKYYLGGAAAFVGLVIIILLVVCIFKKSCWLHKKMFQQQTVPMPGDLPKEEESGLESNQLKGERGNASSKKGDSSKVYTERKKMSPVKSLKRSDKKVAERAIEIRNPMNRRKRSKASRGKCGSTPKDSDSHPRVLIDEFQPRRKKSTSYRAKMQDLDEYEHQVLGQVNKKKARRESKESAVLSRTPGKASEENANQSVVGAAPSRKSVMGAADQVNEPVNPCGGMAAAVAGQNPQHQKGHEKQTENNADQTSEEESPDVYSLSDSKDKRKKPSLKKPEKKKMAPARGHVVRDQFRQKKADLDSTSSKDSKRCSRRIRKNKN